MKLFETTFDLPQQNNSGRGMKLFETPGQALSFSRSIRMLYNLDKENDEDSIPCEYCDRDTPATHTVPVAIGKDDYEQIPVCREHYEKYDWREPDTDEEILSDEDNLE